jgi:hypothetical protein
MWRLRLFFERIGWKPFVNGVVVVAVLVVAGVGFAVVRGDDKPAAQTQSTAPAGARTSFTYGRSLPTFSSQGAR